MTNFIGCACDQEKLYESAPQTIIRFGCRSPVSSWRSSPSGKRLQAAHVFPLGHHIDFYGQQRRGIELSAPSRATGGRTDRLCIGVHWFLHFGDHDLGIALDSQILRVCRRSGSTRSRCPVGLGGIDHGLKNQARFAFQLFFFVRFLQGLWLPCRAASEAPRPRSPSAVRRARATAPAVPSA